MLLIYKEWHIAVHSCTCTLHAHMYILAEEVGTVIMKNNKSGEGIYNNGLTIASVGSDAAFWILKVSDCKLDSNEE